MIWSGTTSRRRTAASARSTTPRPTRLAPTSWSTSVRVVPARKRLIPAGAIAALDHDGRKVRLALTKDEITAAPDYDPDRWNDDERRHHGQYYGPCITA